MVTTKNTIPVYDISSLRDHKQMVQEVIAEPFAPYLAVHPNLHAPHGHSFYHIVIFTKGDGYHSIDFEKFAVVPGQIYFMCPGQVHSWHFTGDVDGYVINFSEDFFYHFLANDRYLDQFTFFRGIAADSVRSLFGPTLLAVISLIENIVSETANPVFLTADMVRLYLAELFITVERIATDRIPGSVPQQNQLILYNFRKLTNNYYDQKRLPKEYAEMLYITPNHLNAICKDLLNKSAGEVIRERVLLEAKRLLVNYDLAISMIADRLSFVDNSHFTKFFKKYTGATPEYFRQGSRSII
jgi:AraC-like DNA-binding protein